MKILVDMNLSPSWVGFFSANGIEAVHWMDLGPGDADDATVLSWARDHGYIVLREHAGALDQGAIVTVVEHMSRVRVLPIGRRLE